MIKNHQPIQDNLENKDIVVCAGGKYAPEYDLYIHTAELDKDQTFKLIELNIPVPALRNDTNFLNREAIILRTVRKRFPLAKSYDFVPF